MIRAISINWKARFVTIIMLFIAFLLFIGSKRDVIFEKRYSSKLHDGTPIQLHHITTKSHTWLDLGGVIVLGGGDIRTQIEVFVDGHTIVFDDLLLEPVVFGRAGKDVYFLTTQDVHTTNNRNIKEHENYSYLYEVPSKNISEVSIGDLPRALLIQNLWEGLWLKQFNEDDGKQHLVEFFKSMPDPLNSFSETARLWRAVECPQKPDGKECLARYNSRYITPYWSGKKLFGEFFIASELR